MRPLTREAAAYQAGAGEALLLLAKASALVDEEAIYTYLEGRCRGVPDLDAVGPALTLLDELKGLLALAGPVGDGARWAAEREEPAAKPVAASLEVSSFLRGPASRANNVATMFNRSRAVMDLASGRVRPKSLTSPSSAACGWTTQLAVLLHLVSHADDDGTIAVSPASVDAETGVGPNAARRCLKALRMAGLITSRESPRATSLYTIMLGRETAESGEAVAAE